MRYLLDKCSSQQQKDHATRSFKILVGGNAEDMGTKFKVVSLFPTTLNKIIRMRGGVPAGFGTAINDYLN